ncbi:hypothetical protein CP532_6488 [Ophiocordyceps camponoti-leonardi (nom. inval.)]|nr:hypothetical protein CP532_6488 [Ophiocordyceps camponoti-leonardi (nom. inval.)]
MDPGRSAATEAGPSSSAAATAYQASRSVQPPQPSLQDRIKAAAAGRPIPGTSEESKRAFSLCLISINGQFPPYHHNTIRQVGTGYAPGIFSDAEFLPGEFAVPVLNLRLQGRDHVVESPIFHISLPVDKFLERAKIDTLSTSNTALITHLFGHLGDVETGSIRPHPSQEKSDLPPADEPIATSLAKHCPEIVRVQVAVPFQYIIAHLSSTFFAERWLQNPDLRRIASDLHAQLNGFCTESVAFTLYIESRDDSPMLSIWSTLTKVDITRSPFRQYLMDSHGEANNLTFENIVLDSDNLPKRPPSGTHCFYSSDHRTVALIAGVAEEQEYQDSLAIASQSVKLPCRIFPDPTSIWKPQKTDLSVYGVAADGSPQAVFVLVDPGTSANLLPTVHGSVAIVLDIPQKNRPAPLNVPFGPREATRAGIDLFDAFLRYENDGYEAKELKTRIFHQRTADGDTQERIGQAFSQAAAEPRQTILRRYADHIFLMGIQPDPEIVAAYPDRQIDYQRTLTARAIAKDLLRRDEERDTEYQSRLITWVRSRGAIFPQRCPQPQGEPFEGRRIPLPSGIVSSTILFHVRVPRCINWHPNFEAPPILISVPPMPGATSMRQFISMTGPTTFPLGATVWWEPNVVTSKMECAAISKLNKPCRYDGVQAWWRFMVSWKGYDGPMRNLLEAFPRLRADLLEGKFSQDSARVISCLQRTRAGIAFVTGCPGSGKSTLGMRVVGAAFAAPVGSGWIAASELQGDFRTTTEMFALPRPFNHREDLARRPDLSSDPLPQPGQFFSHPPASGPAIATDAVPTPAHGRAIWIAPSNELCNDALQRAKRQFPGKIILRVFPINAEKTNVLEFQPAVPAGFGDVATLSRIEQDFATHLHRMRLQRHAETSPAACKDSLSETAKRFARAADEYRDFVTTANLRTSQPEIYRRRLTDLKAQSRALLQLIIANADMIIATPVAIAEMADSFNFAPDLVIVDEAGRMTEASALIPVARYPAAAFLYIGDPRQFGPIAALADVKDVPSVFSRQRQLSLLHRAFLAACVDGVLSTNYRCQGDVASWAQIHHYSSTMHVFHRHSPTVAAFRQHLQPLAVSLEDGNRVLSNSMWLDLQDLPEQRIGTSFANIAQARVGIAVIVQLFLAGAVTALDTSGTPRSGKILIICAYAQQRAVYLDLLRSLSPQPFPANTVSVRTIDNSQSHEAELVLIDLVRSSSAGFLNTSERLIVATTRARIGSIIMMNTEAVPRYGPLRSLLEWHQDRSAVHEFGREYGFNVFCNFCFTFGHAAAECTAALICRICQGKHAVFHCPKGDDFDFFGAPPDDVVRNIGQAPVNPKQQKRRLTAHNK